ncbi:MAG TPA: EF-hand domain-containing protein [Gammaproteobacteria bacterium]
MNNHPLSAISLSVLLIVCASSVFASDDEITSRGPVPFEQFDADGDDTISEEEYLRVHTLRMEKRGEEGRGMRYSDDTSRFDSIDTDGNGRISREELRHHQQNRQEMREEWRKQRQESGGMGDGRGQ